MRANLPVAWITHPLCRRHRISDTHPESPQRLAAIEDRLLAAGLFGFMHQYEAPEASVEQLQRVHTNAHVEHMLAHRDIGGEQGRAGVVDPGIDRAAVAREHIRHVLEMAGLAGIGGTQQRRDLVAGNELER